MLDLRVHPVTSNAATITLCGALTAVTAERLRAALTVLLNSGRVTTIHLDLTGLHTIDDLGAANLAVAGRICRDLSVVLDIRGPAHTRTRPQRQRTADLPTRTAPTTAHYDRPPPQP